MMKRIEALIACIAVALVAVSSVKSADENVAKPKVAKIGVNLKNNDGVTALHIAAFFGYPEAVKLLLDKGALANAKSKNTDTPLNLVTREWNDELIGVYRGIEQVLKIELNLERIKSVRPQIVELLRRRSVDGLEKVAPTKSQGSYAMNGRIRVGLFGHPDGKPLTCGPMARIHHWMVYCFHSNTGKELWKHETHTGPPKVPRHPKNTYASETPTTDGERLYVLFGDLGLYCYDLNGKPL